MDGEYLRIIHEDVQLSAEQFYEDAPQPSYSIRIGNI